MHRTLPFLTSLSLSADLACRKLASDSVLVGLLEVVASMDEATAADFALQLLEVVWQMLRSETPGVPHGHHLPARCSGCSTARLAST
jgi:hypothetical protein